MVPVCCKASSDASHTVVMLHSCYRTSKQLNSLEGLNYPYSFLLVHCPYCVKSWVSHFSMQTTLHSYTNNDKPSVLQQGKGFGLVSPDRPFPLWVGYETNYRVDQLVYIPGIGWGTSESLHDTSTRNRTGEWESKKVKRSWIVMTYNCLATQKGISNTNCHS